MFNCHFILIIHNLVNILHTVEIYVFLPSDHDLIRSEERRVEKHAKREAKAILKHKYYWVHKEEDICFDGMKDVYKIMNNQDKVTMKRNYHIRYDTDLDDFFCAMRRIPCSCTGCVEQLYNPWLPNLDKTLQPRYAFKPKICKYSSILLGYNKWYISKLIFFLKIIWKYAIYYSYVIWRSTYMFWVQ